MKIIITFLLFLLLIACDQSSASKIKEDLSKEKSSIAPGKWIIKDKNTVKSRFMPPEGFSWVNEKPQSFGFYIQNLNLKPYGTPILKYDGKPISTQNLHEAVFDISVGTKDLQQCADAVIRLRADYLKSTGKENEIGFHYTSGHFLRWKDYQNGERLVVKGNTVTRVKNAAGPSENIYPNYLENIYKYAGTISLTKETNAVKSNSDLKCGDILITPGSPGHVVFISGVAKNAEGKKLYLLGQGFTPAQSIHILSNPFQKEASPWYELDVNAEKTETARYSFSPTNFRSF